LSTTIIFIRHGQTEWNVEGRLQGRVDIPLNQVGRDQARRNGAALGRYLTDIGKTATDFSWVTSPLSRSRETMDIVLETMGLGDLTYALDDRLMEMSFGTMEGSTKSELKAKNRDLMRRRSADKWAFVPPGGESYAQLCDRISAWWQSLTVDTVAVSHGGVSRALRGMYQQVDPEKIPHLEVPQDRFHVLKGGIVETI